MISSVTFWTEAARSISRWVSRASGCAAGRRRDRGTCVDRHGEAGRVVEIALVEPERAVLLHVDHLVHDEVGVPWLAVGREPHDLVLAGVDLEARVVGEGRVEQTEAVRPMDLLHGLRACCRGRSATDVVAHSPTPSMVRTTASSNGDGKKAEAAWLSWCSAKRSLPSIAAAWRERRQRLLEARLLEQLLLDPHRHRHAEGGEALRGVGEIGLEQALELDERLLEEDDVVDVVEVDLPGLETVPIAWSGKPAIVLLAGEALLLRGRDDAAVLDEGGRAVVIKGAENPSRCLALNGLLAPQKTV